ncbi:MAG: uracil-DNA glycosylase [Planctomycetaceae bacterium]|nr:uracil-DNA glycosylase [Planctomycetaceae bacterium]
MRQTVIQHLESLQRSGVSSWKPIAPAVMPEAPTEIPAATAAPAVVAAGALFPTEPAPAMPKRAPQPSATRCQEFRPLELPAAERPGKLAELQARVAACTRCQELAATRTQTVFGVGNPNARLLFIGEAPGADEDRLGEPFVGKAGQLLNDIIKACRIKREDVYICNILRCRPPGNRLPSLDEAEHCREFLDGQIAVVNPEYIVCWGSCAARNLLGSEEAIGKMRGKFYSYGPAKVLCTFHPSYLLRNPAAKKDVWDDMKFLFRDMGVDLTAK